MPETDLIAAPGRRIDRPAKPWLEGGRRNAEPDANYYDIPMLKAHVWTPEVTWYFYLGGLSVGAFVLGRVADRVGGERCRAVARTSAYVAAAAIAPCAPLLIKDLGDPKRFHHMLRVWKPSSPMNLGSWVLTAFTPLVLLAALREAARDGIGPFTRLVRALDLPITAIADLAGIPLGLLLSTYTGILLSGTAAPVWSGNPYLGSLFTTSALGTGAAAVHLALEAQQSGNEPEDTAVETALTRYEMAAHAAEAVELAAFGRHAGPRAKPLRTGRAGAAFWIGAVGIGTVLPVVLEALPAPRPARKVFKRAAGVATLIGGFALRWALMEAGRLSANDPQAARDASRPAAPANSPHEKQR